MRLRQLGGAIGLDGDYGPQGMNYWHWFSIGKVMLQDNRTDDSVHSGSVLADYQSVPALSLPAVVAFFRRRLSIILMTCLVTLGLAIAYLVTTVPTFTARAELVVDAKKTPGDAASVSTIVESQIGIIKSESIAGAVIGKLDLTDDPEFVQHDGFLHGLTSAISRRLGWSKPQSDGSATRLAVEMFQRRLSAKRIGPTYLVEIAFESRDPDRAAQILNAVAEKYITHRMDTQSLLDEPWVKDRLNELSTQASAAQRQLEDNGAEGGATAESDETKEQLEAAAEAARSAYDNFVHVLRKMEAVRQQSSPVFEASLVTGASPPLRASWPKPRSVLGISILGGVLLGVGLGLLRDLLSQSHQTSLKDPRPVIQSLQEDTMRSAPDVVRGSVQAEGAAMSKTMRLTSSG